MNTASHRYAKKAFILIVALLFLYNACIPHYSFAGSTTTAEKIQVQEKQDAAYAPSQLIQREANSKEIVESKNEVINKSPSPVESKITEIVEFAGTDTTKTISRIDKIVQDFLKNQKQGTDASSSKELIDLIRRELSVSSKGDPDEEKRRDKAIEDFIKQKEAEERAREEQAKRDEPKRTIVWVAGQPILDAIKPIVYLTAEVVFDTNNDGQINESDQDIAEVEKIFNAHKDHITYYCENNGNSYDVYSIEDPGMRDLLGKLLVWAMQNSDTGAISLYIGDGIEIEFSQFKDSEGESKRLTLKNKDWQITITHYVPDRGVDMGTPKYVRKAFRDIEDTKNRLEGNANKEGARTAIFEEGDKNAGQEVVSHKPYVQEGKERIAKKRDSSSTYAARLKPNSSEKKEVKTAAGRKTLFAAKDKKVGSEDVPAKDVDRTDAVTPREAVDHTVIVESEWGEAKGTLNKVFERVLAEKPGAVYLGGNGSISAIILLTSAVAPDNKNNQDNEGEKDKNS